MKNKVSFGHGHTIKLTLLFIQLCYHFTSVKSDCTITRPSDIETSLLKRLDPLKGKHFEVSVKPEDGKKYDYYLGICTEPKLPKDEGVAPPLSGMVQVITEKKSKKVAEEKQQMIVVGNYNQTQLLGGDGWILLKYQGGQKYQHRCRDNSSTGGTNQQRQAFIMITCGPAKNLNIIEENSEIEEEECYYLFQLENPAACTPQDGLSAGSIFCIVLLTSVGLYLLIGFLHQRIVVGAKGLEQIPNYNLWKEFGKLQADGCDFLCRCGERQEAKMYRGIDDQLLNPEGRDERDDRLLPM